MRDPFPPLLRLCARLVGPLFLLAGVAAGMAVLIFPAVKGVWLGYAPVAAGAVLWWAAYARRESLRRLLMRPGERMFVGGVLAGPVLVQGFLLLVFRSEPSVDGLFVYREALTLFETGRMSPLTYYAPAQVWWYAGWFKVFGTSVLAAQSAHLPWAMLSVGVLYAWALRSLDPGTARCVTAAWACYPSFLLYVLVTPYYFYMYTACILLLTYTWQRALEERNGTWWAVAGGVVAGWGALTKAVLLMAPGLALAAWLVWEGRLFARRPWSRFAWFSLAMALTLAPWVARNQAVFGEPVLVCTSGGLVFHSANNAQSNGLYSEVPDHAAVTSPEEMLEHARASSEKGWAYIREQPRAWLRLVGWKNLHTWGNETTYLELVNRAGRRPAWLDPFLSALVQTGWAFVVAGWACSAWRGTRRPRTLSWAALVTLGWVASTVLVYSLYEGGSRHHLPLVPLLLGALAVIGRKAGGHRADTELTIRTS